MKPENFEIDYKNLIDEMAMSMNDHKTGREIIDDGVLNIDKYFANDFRIAWMLKEPYDEGGGGWCYMDMFKGEDLYESQFKFGHRTTWHPIIYTSHSIHNGFPKWEEIEYIRDDHDLANIVKEVAFINAQKLPSKNGTRTNMEDIVDSVKKHGNLLIRQKELLNPNILIFANTFEIYRNLLGLESKELNRNGSCEYLIDCDKLYISAYHPAQTQISTSIYVNDIVEVVRHWKNQQN